MCICLNDNIPNRFHWPLGCQLAVNGISYRTYSRPASTKLGMNQRDVPANITTLVKAGRNAFTGYTWQGANVGKLAPGNTWGELVPTKGKFWTDAHQG